jgi:hypothetical protein
MAREIIQIIRCDRCGNKIETEDEVVRMTISIGQTTYELEVDELCDNFGLWTLEDVIEKGHITTMQKRSRKKKGNSGHKEAAKPDDLVCGYKDCTFIGKSPQGLGRHKTAQGHHAEEKVAGYLVRS